MILPIKIEFREYPAGTFEDWSDILAAAPTIVRRVESDNAGEAGVIIFDNAAVLFRYEEDNLAYAVFSDEESLSTAVRFVFQIWNNRKGFFEEDLELVTHTGDTIVTDEGDTLGANYLDEQSVKVFEGMADFSTIQWPQMGRVISLDIIDKLSALGVLTNDGGRTLYDTTTAIIAYAGFENLFKYARILGKSYTADPDGNSPWIRQFEVFFVSDDLDDHGDVEELFYEVGEIIVHPDDKDLPVTEQRKALVIESSLVFEASVYVVYSVSPFLVDRTYTNVTYNRFKIFTIDSDFDSTLFNIYVGGSLGPKSYLEAYTSEPGVQYWKYEKNYYGVDINIITSGALTGFDGPKLIQALYNQQWGDPDPVTMVLKPSTFTFTLPMDYYVQLITEQPFEGDPLSAVKKLANTMKCYVYVDRSSNLVIHSKASLATSGTTRTIGNTPVIRKKKKFFWNKLVDGVTVKVKSWVVDGGGLFLESEQTATKQIPGSTGTIQPRNKITKELLVSDPDANTQELIDAFAMAEAEDILEFYGVRRGTYDLVLQLDENTEQWELVDNLVIDGADYFFTSIAMDQVERTVSLEPVEAVGHEYDLRQIVITPGN